MQQQLYLELPQMILGFTTVNEKKQSFTSFRLRHVVVKSLYFITPYSFV